ncbi:uncharacterized protein LOC127259287 [Andrographis paniculata]|uniref:uncharacterized protein LOC127259287 n=1 Tax=Andrographis paniculata TaxID=175694 RepID=UPI0021E7A2C7|nr:uncharacterized protein LOC127259287 [Andrographis paniculata]
MSSAMAAASCSSISTRLVTKSNSNYSAPQIHVQRTSFHGVTLEEAKRNVFFFSSLVAEADNSISTSARKRGLEINARTAAGAGKSIEVEVDKPLGLTLGQKQGGGVVITAVQSGGNAARAGLKAGDQVLYTSSFFGDELWPADKLGFTKTAIQAKPDSVYFVISRGAEVDVKRLPKRPAPPSFGRKLTDAQKARATHICLDCGYIYTLSKPFEEQGEDYACPQCRAPKKRFARYDAEKGKAVGGGLPIGVIVGLVVGAAGAAALVLYGLQ